MENYEAVRKALLANRANTLALLGCLRETLEERPFREAEDALAGSRAMALTTQTPHALYAMLLKCGAVEAIEVSPVEGVRSTGASFLEEIIFGVIPQVFPLWISYSLYRFEANVRSATVVGMVGAGGIGMVLWELIRSFAFEQTCAVMSLIVLVVVVFDMLSQQLRKRVL